jgi:molybdopterin-synthase adenylyltransferase
MNSETPIRARLSRKIAPARNAHSELVLPAGMWLKIHEYLFADKAREYACYLLCGHRRSGRLTRLFANHLFLPEPSDYVHQSVASVHVSQSVLAELLRECKRLGLSLIDLHSHPFSKHDVAFSGVDEADEIEKAAWFAEHLPQCFYGSIVLGTHSHQARIRSASGAITNERLVIKPLDVPLAPSGASARPSPRFVDRHVRAFGAAGQARLGAAHVGIVGLGGLGSALAIGLARLGVVTFTLVDHDRAEPHNLNRLAGMRAHDARAKTKKTRLVRRELLAINPAIDCRRVTGNLLEPDCWPMLLDCDLILAATDNHSSRFLLNALSEQYLVPQVSVGSLIEVDAEGKIESACGHVRVLLPGAGNPCLLCSRIVDPAEVYYETVAPDHRRQAASRGYVANFDEPAPAVVHLNGVLVNLALIEIHNLFCGFKDVSPYLFFDLLNQEILKIAEEPSDCVVCSRVGDYFGRGDLADLNSSISGLLPK